MASRKIKIGIFTAKNLKTSTGSNNTVLNILNNLDADKYAASVVLIDDLIPSSLKLSVDEMAKKDPTYKPFTLIRNDKLVERVGVLHWLQNNLNSHKPLKVLLSFLKT